VVPEARCEETLNTL